MGYSLPVLSLEKKSGFPVHILPKICERCNGVEKTFYDIRLLSKMWCWWNCAIFLIDFLLCTNSPNLRHVFTKVCFTICWWWMVKGAMEAMEWRAFWLSLVTLVPPSPRVTPWSLLLWFNRPVSQYSHHNTQNIICTKAQNGDRSISKNRSNAQKG